MTKYSGSERTRELAFSIVRVQEPVHLLHNLGVRIYATEAQLAANAPQAWSEGKAASIALSAFEPARTQHLALHMHAPIMYYDVQVKAASEALQALLCSISNFGP